MKVSIATVFKALQIAREQRDDVLAEMMASGGNPATHYSDLLTRCAVLEEVLETCEVEIEAPPSLEKILSPSSHTKAITKDAPAPSSRAYLASECPDCPNCGAKTIRNGACFKCANCGFTVGAS